jgi:hypothetical protein
MIDASAQGAYGVRFYAKGAKPWADKIECGHRFILVMTINTTDSGARRAL